MIPHQLKWSKIITNNGSHNSNNNGAPQNRDFAATVVYRDQLFIHGGYYNDFWSYNFKSKTFQQIEIGNHLRKKHGHAMVVSDEENAIYLFGGFYSDWYRRPCSTNDFSKYSVQSNEWTSIQGKNIFPSPRGFFVSFVHDSKLFVFGGLGMDYCIKTKFYNDFYAFDFKNQTWMNIHMTGSIPSPRCGCAWVKYENHLYTYGGFNNSYCMSDFFKLNLYDYKWTRIESSGNSPPSRRFLSAFVHNKLLYIIGELDNSGRFVSVYSYDFSAKHWSQYWSEIGEGPNEKYSSRDQFVAQTYKDEIYVLGAQTGYWIPIDQSLPDPD